MSGPDLPSRITKFYHHPPQKRQPRLHYCKLVVAGIFLCSFCCSSGGLIPFASFIHQSTAKAQSADCSDLEIIFARGSGENLHDRSAETWEREIRSELANTGLKLHFYELGSDPSSPARYPAVAVGGSLDATFNLIGAALSGGGAFEFGRSVAAGVSELTHYVSAYAAACPDTQFVLGGYSQGAMVVMNALPSLTPSQILYVGTFGDPKLYLPEGRRNYAGRIPKLPDACYGRNLSEYRGLVPDCYASDGVLGGRNPYRDKSYSGKVYTWCNDKDLMCSSGFSIEDHTGYVDKLYYQKSAAKLAKLVFKAFKLSHSRRNVQNIAFLIDSSRSMQNSIDLYRSEAYRLASKVIASGGRIALFEYRDLKDPFLTRMLCDFSCTLDEFSDKLTNIEVGGGGDIRESALSAIMFALNHLDWQFGTSKSVVILSDASYHVFDRDGTTVYDVIDRSLEIDPVSIYAIISDTSSNTLDIYRRLTDATSGATFRLGTDLSTIADTISERPVAELSLPEYSGVVGQPITFDASASFALDGSKLTFDWDFNGNGIDLRNGSSVETHTYKSPFEGYVEVKITDAAGRTNSASSKLSIQARDQSSVPVSITNLRASAASSSSAHLTFDTDADQVLVAVNDALIGFAELFSGHADLTIDDLAGKTTIRLIPYSADQHRGTSAVATLDFDNPASPPPSRPLPPSTGVVSSAYYGCPPARRLAATSSP